MGKPSRDKGARAERELVNDLLARGLKAKRVPLSGATSYAKDDVEVVTPLSTLHIEVKRRAAPISKALEDALGETADMVATRADGGPWRWYVTHEWMVRLMAALREAEGRALDDAE
jgi:Holliday junction resolvase